MGVVEPLGGEEGQLSLMDLKAIADQYGVGFMVGEVGIFHEKGAQLLTETYPREVIYAYYEDYISLFNELDTGWTIGGTTGEFSILTAYPSVESCEYEPLEGTNRYIDAGMIEFLRIIQSNIN